MNRKQKKVFIRICITSLALVGLFFIPVTGLPRLLLYLIVYLVIGYDILKKAVRGILNGQVFDENFLMAIATVGAFALAIITKSGEYTEGIAVMLFYQIGELFQSYAIGKSRKNITALMDIRPDYANIEENGKLIQVDPDEVPIGSTIVVLPGEKVPIDGILIKGQGSLNTSALTGESIPKDVMENDEIISGSISINSELYIKTTKEFGESTVSKILELVENASSRKSKTEAFISRFAKVYTPAVCLGAAILLILPPLIQIIMGGSPQWTTWLYRALTFLVVSCPCALVISIPLSFFAGIGGASKEGILIKGSNYLETLSKVKYVLFDKTGTLTEGVFKVSGVHHNNIPEDKLIEYAALCECSSTHPISKSLREAYGKDIDRNRVTQIEEISGHGITAKVDGMPVAAGNGRLMDKLNISYDRCQSIGTVVHLAVNGEYAGHIVISDLIKKNSKSALSALKNSGIKKTILLTGDMKSVAETVGNELGIDEIRSELLPGDKVNVVESYINNKKPGEMVAFVGDGINDAPVLTRADIGIAMGAMGSDAAIEAADIVLMDDDPLSISKAIRISKKCLGIVKQNIIFALIVKFGCLGLTAIGLANMWLAIFADVGVMVIAVLNAIRALKVK